MGLGLGILHAQITAYDPQRRSRIPSLRPVLESTSTLNTVDLPEPSQIPKSSTETAASVSKNILQSESNVSNRTGILLQSGLSLDINTVISKPRESEFNQTSNLPDRIRYGSEYIILKLVSVELLPSIPLLCVYSLLFSRIIPSNQSNPIILYH